MYGLSLESSNFDEFDFITNPPCDARRRENVGALYGAVSGLLAVIRRAYTPYLSLAAV